MRLEPQIFSLDRRRFLKAGSAGLALLALNPQRALAEGFCEDVSGNTNAIDEVNPLAAPDGILNFWADGLFFRNGRSNLSRGSLALHLNLPQTRERYVEKVILLEDSGSVLGAHYFRPDDATPSGGLPYVTFRNLDLNDRGRYFVIYQVREGNTVKVYRFVIVEMRRSRLNSDQLPAEMRADFSRGFHGGVVTDTFQFQSESDIRQLSARGRLQQLGDDGKFTIAIELMHGDISPEHYCRYFIVTDPVGRLLGAVKRQFGEAPHLNRIGPFGAMRVNAMNETERELIWGLTRDKVASILDCPYVMIFTDNGHDALAKSTLYLI